MNRFVCLVLALAACHTESRPEPKTSADFEARLKRLEDDNAKYKAELEWLGGIYKQQLAQQEEQERDEPAPDAVFAVDIAQDLKAGHFEGPATAAVTIVEAFDFACPYCRRVSDTLNDLVKVYDGKVRIVYKHMIVHPEVATHAHLAACAAAKQGKYVAFKNAVWTKGFDAYAAARDQSKLAEEALYVIAKDVGLDIKRLKTDMTSDACKQQVDADMQELAKFHVNATPTLFVNGTHVGGAMPEDVFKQMIDEKLQLVTASGVSPAEYYDKVIMGKGEKKFRSKKDPKPS